jgi:type III restriction enzyme
MKYNKALGSRDHIRISWGHESHPDITKSMSNPFFDQPILNSPYDYPHRYWELDEAGQPTQKIIESRRSAKFITPIPKPKKHKVAAQTTLIFDEGKGLSTKEQQYDPTSIINEVRGHVDAWRSLKNSSQWQVTPETARLLQHWRHHQFSAVRPFFCQIEATETAIWLTEVATQSGRGKRLLDHLAAANKDANPELMRIALKLATGAGKTTVMAMLIAWQTINAVRRPGSKHFTRGFLVCAPGLTIKDRLRVLLPSDPDSYYAGRELVPSDMLDDVKRAKIVITNFHAFKLRERIELSKGGRQLLQGRTGEELNTQETEGQMLQRVMPDLMGMKNILVINDEAHHCYREKPKEADDEELKGDDKKEAEKSNEAARLWISGLEAVNRKLGVSRVIDLSATPFFLRGSGYAEGTLFPWTMSDFSLMDAIECGIVKLPRVPVAENIPGNEMPMFRNLWENIRKDMPKKGRGKGEDLDPLKLPTRLQTALDALYGHYEKTFKIWQDKGSRCRRASSSSVRTPRYRSSSTISSPGSIARRRTAAQSWSTAGCRCFAILTRSPATRCRARTRCLSIASSSKQAMRSTIIFDLWRPTRSTASAARKSSARAMPMPPRTSPTRSCCAK